MWAVSPEKPHQTWRVVQLTLSLHTRLAAQAAGAAAATGHGCFVGKHNTVFLPLCICFTLLLDCPCSAGTSAQNAACPLLGQEHSLSLLCQWPQVNELLLIPTWEISPGYHCPRVKPRDPISKQGPSNLPCPINKVSLVFSLLVLGHWGRKVGSNPSGCGGQEGQQWGQAALLEDALLGGEAAKATHVTEVRAMQWGST